jgi:hypothetical protein
MDIIDWDEIVAARIATVQDLAGREQATTEELVEIHETREERLVQLQQLSDDLRAAHLLRI